MNNQIFDLEYDIQSAIERIKKIFHLSSLKELMRDSHQNFKIPSKCFFTETKK